MIDQLKDYKQHFESIDDALDGDCPDEFMDELMQTIMQDPVILPSGHRCDRNTIIRQLAVSPIDPFTRAPLTVEMLKPDVELKKSIYEYIRAKVEELNKKP